ncbi:DUF3175 domain-containing protein [bacterium]|nr:MAG: DUF3175 domain-containing protein [bacterium]
MAPSTGVALFLAATSAASARFRDLSRADAEASSARKATPYQAAMSMLNFYVNRAGRQLCKERRDVLERAKTRIAQGLRAHAVAASTRQGGGEASPKQAAWTQARSG